MKKALLFLPFLLALASCGESIPNQAGVDSFKALLAKQDTSPALRKIFSAEFIQNYDVFTSTSVDQYHLTKFHSYRGGGAFGVAYSVDQDAYDEAMAQEGHDFFDFLSRGTGGYGLLQSATVTSYHYEKDGNDIVNLPMQNENFLQNIQTNFGNDDVQVSSALVYSEGTQGENTRSQKFNGMLSKDVLFENISVRTLSNLFARTNLYDGQRSCETIDRIYEETLGDLSKKSDKELSEFIAKNHIEIEENEENALLHFELYEEGILETLAKEGVIPGVMKGTLTYDKENGEYLGFEYSIVSRDGINDTEAGKSYSASMEFTVKGYSKNEEFPGDIYISPDPEVYEDGEAFLNDMIAGIIPDIA